MSIVVSICCLSYNHVQYIKQCLDGFVMQKTNFEYEVLIHDDASTDATADIIREYEKAYPNIIKPIYQVENQYSKGVGVTRVYQFPRAKGKYLAFCEGDDYWIDPYKLQNQVDFLEQNSDFGLVHTDYHQYFQKTSELKESFNKSRKLKCTDGLIFENLLKLNYVAFLTVMFRRELLILEEFNQITEDLKVGFGDYTMWLYLSSKTKFKYFNEPTAVYRILEQSASHFGASKAKYFKQGEDVYKTRFYFISKYGCSQSVLTRLEAERDIFYLKYYNFLLDYNKSSDYYQKIDKSTKPLKQKVLLFLLNRSSSGQLARKLLKLPIFILKKLSNGK